MYGGFDKSSQQIKAEVKLKVIGQDETVDWLCSFMAAACERSRLIREGRYARADLPTMSCAMLVGPTASGKSHLMKTFASSSGLRLFTVDATQLTAMGWRGQSLATHLYEASLYLQENPDGVALFFVDEVDKVFVDESSGGARQRGGSPKFDLLKVLEGGVQTSETDGQDPKRFTIDLDRCVFVLAGAFTGIEELIAKRLGVRRRTVGFGQEETDTGEHALRGRISKEDLEAFGMPRELVGRISSVAFMPKLSPEAMGRIVGLKQDEYSHMLGGVPYVIEAEAQSLLVQRATEAEYGARLINQDLTDVFVRQVWPRIESNPAVREVRIGADADMLKAEVVPAQPGDTDTYQQPASARPSTIPSELLARVRTLAEFTEKITPPMDSREALAGFCGRHPQSNRERADLSADAIAVHLLACSEDLEHHIHASDISRYSACEVSLLYAMLTLLRDWFPDDYNLPTLPKLLSMAREYDEHETPLDVLFSQIHTGTMIVRAEDTDTDGSGWKEVPTDMCRRTDNCKPGERGGLSPEEDESLRCYLAYREFPADARREAVGSLALRILSV